MAAKINPFLLFALIIIISGCYTTNRFIPIKIEVLHPAYFPSPPGTRIVAGSYNNSNFMNDSTNSLFSLNTRLLRDTLNTDSTASVVYYESMINSLRTKNYFDSVIDLGKHYPNIGKDSILFFNDTEFDSLINKDNCNIVYSLCWFQVNDISFSMKGDLNETEIVVSINAIWEISSYDSTVSRILINHTDSIIYSSRFNSFNVQKRMLKDRPDLIKEAAKDLGTKLALFLVPHWEEVERLYYKSGNLQMKLATEYVKNNEWLKAAEIWKPLTSNKNKNIAAKSMFNLALACEMNGNFDAALDWVVKSYYVFLNDNPQHAFNCKDYIRLLALRKAEEKALENQVGNLVR